ncbi:Uncharacterized protein Fot_31665 [Forsythia ovata]|uniref:Uncharacterized protein n=1 Tax=Forsythia ovata TaxID=205694 RepID=A0ABD1T5K9_9LAMI
MLKESGITKIADKLSRRHHCNSRSCSSDDHTSTTASGFASIFCSTAFATASCSTTATSEVLSTVPISTQVTSQGEFDEDAGSDHRTRSQSGNESEDSSRESPQTEHLEEEQQKSGSDFADDNVEEEEDSTNEEGDNLSAEESVPVKLSRAQKGKQKIDESLNVADLPTEHQNVGYPSSDVPTPKTHHQLFEQSLLRKGNHVSTSLNYKFWTLDAQAQFQKFISNRDFVMEFNVKEDILREADLVELIEHWDIQKMLG